MSFWAAILAHPVVAVVWAGLILVLGIEVGIVLEMRWQETMRRMDDRACRWRMSQPDRGRVLVDDGEDAALPAFAAHLARMDEAVAESRRRVAAGGQPFPAAGHADVARGLLMLHCGATREVER